MKYFKLENALSIYREWKLSAKKYFSDKFITPFNKIKPIQRFKEVRKELGDHKLVLRKQLYWLYIALGYRVGSAIIVDLLVLRKVSPMDIEVVEKDIKKHLFTRLNNARHDPGQIVYFTEVLQQLIDRISVLINNCQETVANNSDQRMGFENYWNGVVKDLGFIETYMACTKVSTLSALSDDTKKYFKAFYSIEKRLTIFTRQNTEKAIKGANKSTNLNFSIRNGEIAMIISPEEYKKISMKDGELVKVVRNPKQGTNFIKFVPVDAE